MENRFERFGYTVRDHNTGLLWCRDAGVSEFPLTWKEAFEFAAHLNHQGYGGADDWRLPNRRELFSLVGHDCINPSLPADHPFENVFHGYYWSASTCSRLPSQAWYVHFGGGKVYRGMKYASNMVWPVREAAKDRSGVYLTGQCKCFDADGLDAPCHKHPLQRAALTSGIAWPEPRFETCGKTVSDRLTGLVWTRKASHGEPLITWHAALDIVERMNRENRHGQNDWRMPAIRELESLADLGRHSPALPAGHPFTDISDFYWSKTTSMYEKRYAWTFYAKDGAVGVGFKNNPEFSLWPVRGGGEAGASGDFR